MNDDIIKNSAKQEPAVLDDIFAEEENLPIKTVVDTEKDNSLGEQTVASKIQTIDYENEGLGVLGKIKKYFLKIILAIFLLALISAGVWYRQPLSTFSLKYINALTAKFRTASDNSKISTDNKSADQTAIEEENFQKPQEQPAAIISEQKSRVVDSDYDGLTDEEEKSLGTDPNNVDSDADGLFDREEAKIFKTSPLIPDTDGDGYKDGEEVKAKMNPRGAGKLNEMQ